MPCEIPLSTTGALRYLQRLGLVVAVMLLAACATAPAVSPSSDSHPNLNSVLWTQTAVEYRMSAAQAFRLASGNLVAALADPDWTAMIEQAQQEGFQSLPPAVIMDVDETLLDNSPFQARMILQGSSFDPLQWASWVREEQAAAIPGARAFIAAMRAAGVTPFYVTNREQEAPTLANIREVLDADATAAQVMVRAEQPDWGSDKTSRRLAVASGYRVLLLLGDDYNDFVSLDYDTAVQRNELAEAFRARWGLHWIVLPNPQYGHWERALPDGERSPLLQTAE